MHTRFVLIPLPHSRRLMLRARLDTPIHGWRALLSRLLFLDAYAGVDLEERAFEVRLILCGFGIRLWAEADDGVQMSIRLFWPAGFVDLDATEWKTIL